MVLFVRVFFLVWYVLAWLFLRGVFSFLFFKEDFNHPLFLFLF